MASLVTCKVCKKEHSDDVKRCPHCGAKYSKPLSKRPFAILMMGLTGFIFYQCASVFSGSSSSADNAGGLPVQTTATQVPAPASPTPMTPKVSSWDYRTQPDKMTGKPAQYATLVSDSGLSFSFPYGGENHAQLTIRQHPKHGQDVIFSIEKGQITCSTYDCRLTVRFDNGPPVVYGGSHPSDGSSTHVFLSGSGKFIAQAKKATQILVEFTAYQQGSNVMTFTSATPFAWPK